MRKTRVIGLTAALWLGLASAATPKKVVLDVESVTCPACSITIEKALDKLPGVTGKQVDIQAATVTVTFDPKLVTIPAVARAISDAGFPAKPRANGG